MLRTLPRQVRAYSVATAKCEENTAKIGQGLEKLEAWLTTVLVSHYSWRAGQRVPRCPESAERSRWYAVDDVAMKDERMDPLVPERQADVTWLLQAVLPTSGARSATCARLPDLPQEKLEAEIVRSIRPRWPPCSIGLPAVVVAYVNSQNLLKEHEAHVKHEEEAHGGPIERVAYP